MLYSLYERVKIVAFVSDRVLIGIVSRVFALWETIIQWLLLIPSEKSACRDALVEDMSWHIHNTARRPDSYYRG